MIGRLSNELIADVRESILSDALAELPSAQVKDLESCGVDPREILFALLDYISFKDRGGAATKSPSEL